MKASSSNGRAADSKSAGWGFESLLACQSGFNQKWDNLNDLTLKRIHEDW